MAVCLTIMYVKSRNNIKSDYRVYHLIRKRPILIPNDSETIEKKSSEDVSVNLYSYSFGLNPTI